MASLHLVKVRFNCVKLVRVWRRVMELDRGRLVEVESERREAWRVGGTWCRFGYLWGFGVSARMGARLRMFMIMLLQLRITKSASSDLSVGG